MASGYRKKALDAYESLCAYCGFGIEELLEAAHIDQDRKNNDIDNLVLLCPTCHKMLDTKVIPREVIVIMRNHPKIADWSDRMKDAGIKAAATRKKNMEEAKELRRKIALRAWETRRANEEKKKAEESE